MKEKDLKNLSNTDHFFRGLDSVKKYREQLTLREFTKEVARFEGLSTRLVDTSCVTRGTTALYKAFVRRKNVLWLYLFFPQSENGQAFWTIGRKPLEDTNLHDKLIVEWKLRRECSENFKNSPRIVLSKKEGKK